MIYMHTSMFIRIQSYPRFGGTGGPGAMFGSSRTELEEVRLDPKRECSSLSYSSHREGQCFLTAKGP